MGSASWPPQVKMKTSNQQLPLAILSFAVGMAIIIVLSSRSTRAPQAAAQDGPRAARSGECPAAGASNVERSRSSTAGEADKGDPPAPALPNKFELAKFEEPVYPDYSLAEDSRIGTEAIGLEGPAPRMPDLANGTAEWQVAEESWSTSEPGQLPELRPFEETE